MMSHLTRLLLVAAFLLLAVSAASLLLMFPWLAVPLICNRIWVATRRLKESGWSFSHGSARAATVADMQRAGMLRGKDDGQSLIFGSCDYADRPTFGQGFRALLSPRVSSAVACRLLLSAIFQRCEPGLIRVKDFVHLLTVAPAGAGKSVSVILLNLLCYRGPVVVNDPSGEIFRTAAPFREKVMGRKCIRIDPYGLGGPIAESDCLNPLDFIDPESPDFADMVQMVGDAIVVRDDDHQPHFNEKAIELIAGVSAFVCACEGDPEKRNLALVHTLLSSMHGFEQCKKDMMMVEGFHDIVKLYGKKMTTLKDRELGSVLSTVSRQFGWAMSPQVMECLSRSTFDPRWVWMKNVDIFIMTPHDRLTPLAGFLRLQISTILRMLARTGNEQHPVLFILDEVGHCGRLQLVEDAITLWRKAGIRIWLFVQSLDQLKKCYGERAQTVIDNCSIQQYFGLSSYDTAETLSKRIGDFTQVLKTIAENGGRSRNTGMKSPDADTGSVSYGWTTTISEGARRLLKPEEILLLPADLCLLFMKNMPVMPVKLVKYFKIRGVMKHGTGREKPPGLLAAAFASAAMVLAVLTAMFVASIEPPASREAAELHPPRMQRPRGQQYGQQARYRPPAASTGRRSPNSFLHR